MRRPSFNPLVGYFGVPRPRRRNSKGIIITGPSDAGPSEAADSPTLGGDSPWDLDERPLLNLNPDPSDAGDLPPSDEGDSLPWDAQKNP
jgi:hypothetical protein